MASEHGTFLVPRKNKRWGGGGGERGKKARHWLGYVNVGKVIFESLLKLTLVFPRGPQTFNVTSSKLIQTCNVALQVKPAAKYSECYVLLIYFVSA